MGIARSEVSECSQLFFRATGDILACVIADQTFEQLAGTLSVALAGVDPGNS